MLIIGQPKSASTSLLKSIAQIARIQYKNGQSRGKKDVMCEGFEELQKYHTTTHRRTKKYLISWAKRKDKIYKEHILPTQEHIEALKGQRYIILLRNPEHTIDNYVRLIKTYKDGKLSKHDINELKLELLTNIDFDKFSQDIIDFHNKWKEVEALHIDYDQLVMCPVNTLKKCMSYLGLPIRGKIELLKAKGNHGYNTYTGVGYERAKKKWIDLHS
jgi:hypothetical protein